jgi:hypothetical protein
MRRKKRRSATLMTAWTSLCAGRPFRRRTMSLRRRTLTSDGIARSSSQTRAPYTNATAGLRATGIHRLDNFARVEACELNSEFNEEVSWLQKVRASRTGARCRAERARVRGLSEDGRRVGSPAPLPHVRPRRLLRQLEEQARDEALPLVGPPHNPLLRARRGLGLVLR